MNFIADNILSHCQKLNTSEQGMQGIPPWSQQRDSQGESSGLEAELAPSRRDSNGGTQEDREQTRAAGANLLSTKGLG